MTTIAKGASSLTGVAYTCQHNEPPLCHGDRHLMREGTCPPTQTREAPLWDPRPLNGTTSCRYQAQGRVPFWKKAEQAAGNSRICSADEAFIRPIVQPKKEKGRHWNPDFLFLDRRTAIRIWSALARLLWWRGCKSCCVPHCLYL